MIYDLNSYFLPLYFCPLFLIAFTSRQILYLFSRRFFLSFVSQLNSFFLLFPETSVSLSNILSFLWFKFQNQTSPPSPLPSPFISLFHPLIIFLSAPRQSWILPGWSFVTGLSITIFQGTECQELYLDRPLRHPLGWISHDVIASVASHPWEDFTAHRMTHPFLQLRQPFQSGVTLTNRTPHHQRGPVLPLLPIYLNETIGKGQPVTADSSTNLESFPSSGAYWKTSKCPPWHFPTSND